MAVLYAVLAVLAVVIFLALALLLVKVRIVFKITKNHGEKATNSIRITFFGTKIGFNLKDISRKDNKNKEEKPPEEKKILQKIKDYIKTFKILKEVYGQNKYFIRKRLVLENTNVSVNFGFGNAAVTGIATGAVWTLLYNVLGFLNTVGTVKNHKFDVVPVYNEFGFSMDVNGIISFRLINIIHVVKRLRSTYRAIIDANK